MKRKCLALILALMLSVAPVGAFGENATGVAYAPPDEVYEIGVPDDIGDIGDISEVEYAPGIPVPEEPEYDTASPNDENESIDVPVNPAPEEPEDETAPPSNGEDNSYQTPTQPDEGDIAPEIDDETDGDDGSVWENNGGYVGIAPTSLGPPNIGFYVRCSTTAALLQQRTNGLSTAPFNEAHATDAGFDLGNWPGWEIEFWAVGFEFIVPPPPFFQPPVAISSRLAMRPPYIVPNDPNQVGFLSIGPFDGTTGDSFANFSWGTHPIFDIFIRPQSPSIEKTLTSETPVFQGDVVAFTIKVANPAILPNTWATGAGPYLGANPVPTGSGPPLSTTLFDDFHVQDILPSGLALVPGSIVVIGARDYMDNSSDNTVDLMIDLPHATPNGNGTVYPGVVEITFQALVITSAASFGGTITNDASLTGRGGDVDEEDSVSSNVAASPTLAKSVHQIRNTPITDPVQPVFEGDVVTYRLAVYNPNDRWLNGFIVRDTLPPGLADITNITVSPSNAFDAYGINNASDVLEVILNLPPGPGYTYIDFDVIVDDEEDADANGNFVNTAYLYVKTHAINPGFDPNVPICPDNNPISYTTGDERLDDVGASATVRLAVPGIELEKSVSPTPLVYAGNDLTYTLEVTNTGNVPLYNVLVTDNLNPVSPASPVLPHLDLDGTELVTVSFSGSRPNMTPVPLLSTLMNPGINIGTLAPGEIATLTFIVTVDEDARGGTVLDNEADVVGNTRDGTNGDGEQVDDEDYATTTVISEPDITIVKSAGSPTVVAGGNIQYTLVVTNSGNVDLTNVRVTDDLNPAINPALTHLNLSDPLTVTVHITFSDNRNDYTTSLATLMNPGFEIDNLEVGEYVTLTFTVTVASGVPSGTILRNTATAVGDYTGTGTSVNDTDTATVNVPSPTPPQPPPPPPPPGNGNNNGPGNGGGGGGSGGAGGGGGGWSGSSVTTTPGSSPPARAESHATYDTYPQYPPTYHPTTPSDSDNQYVPSLYMYDRDTDNYDISSDMDTDTDTDTDTNTSTSTSRRNPQTSDDFSFTALFVSAIGFILLLGVAFLLLGFGRRRDAK